MKAMSPTMSSSLVWMSFALLMGSGVGVFGGLLCKDSTLDSITYVKDADMYFFTSGGHYWYIKATDFPPKDSDAKQLPKPFKKGEAAVFIDSMAGCASAKTGDQGVQASERAIWVAEVVNGVHMFVAFDLLRSKWRPAIEYNADTGCLSRGLIEYGSPEPIQAMFSVKNLFIFLVQNGKYTQIDCTFLCTNGEYGTSLSNNPVSDFQSQDPIYGMYTKTDTELFLFSNKTFKRLQITVTPDGKVSAVQDSKKSDIVKDFWKLGNSTECSSGDSSAATPPAAPMDDKAPQPQDTQPSAQSGSSGEKSSSPLIWIVVGVVVVVLVVAGGAFAFFALNKSSSKGPEGGAAAAPNAPKPAGGVAAKPSAVPKK